MDNLSLVEMLVCAHDTLRECAQFCDLTQKLRLPLYVACNFGTILEKPFESKCYFYAFPVHWGEQFYNISYTTNKREDRTLGGMRC